MASSCLSPKINSCSVIAVSPVRLVMISFVFSLRPIKMLCSLSKEVYLHLWRSETSRSFLSIGFLTWCFDATSFCQEV